MPSKLVNKLYYTLQPLLKKYIGHNLIIDRVVRAASASELEGCGVPIEDFAYAYSEYEAWVDACYPEWERYFPDIRFKKMQEFFVSCKLLDIQPEDSFLDAAGGLQSYIFGVQCAEKIIQDLHISEDLKNRPGSDVRLVEGNAAAMPLPDGSIDKIACHHSFEHFQGDADTGFIKEVQRLLRPGGRACIVPIFVGNRFVEVSDEPYRHMHYSPESRFVIDPTATIPGGYSSGNYARIYDAASLRERVLKALDPERFTARIYDVHCDGKPIPDAKLACHKHVTGVNYPYRALLIEKTGNGGTA